MSTNFKNQMKEVISLAWSFVKRNGFSMSEALKCAWANMKLKAQMKSKSVKFYFQKRPAQRIHQQQGRSEPQRNQRMPFVYSQFHLSAY